MKRLFAFIIEEIARRIFWKQHSKQLKAGQLRLKEDLEGMK